MTEIRKKKTIVIIILGIALAIVIGGFVIWRVVSIISTNNHIPDTNGANTEVVTIYPETFDCESFEYYSMVSSSNNYGSKTDAPLIYQECDYKNVNYSFGKFSGVKLLQYTKCVASEGIVYFQIQSELKDGNFEIAIYVNDRFVKTVNINSVEKECFTYVQNDVIKVVAFGESAKCSVSVTRIIE